jgi:hypothetical protein
MNDTVQDDMLRCNPSQIQLTSNDISDLEHHTITRRRALSDVAKGKARLSTGPRLPTFSAAAHDDGITAHHSSTATVHPPSHRKRDTARRPQYAIPMRGASEFALQPNCERHDGPASTIHSRHVANDSHKTVRDDEPVKIDSPQASPSSDPYLSVPPLTITANPGTRNRRPQTSPSHNAEVAIDSASESEYFDCPRPQSATRHTTPMHAGRQVFRELPGSDGRPPPSTRLRRMSATRTRPSESRTHERLPQSQEDSPERPAPISSPRRLRPQRRDPSPTHLVGDLDPGAPAFAPRVRFGSTTVVPERDSEIIDTSNLRIRSPSEQMQSSHGRNSLARIAFYRFRIWSDTLFFCQLHATLSTARVARLFRLVHLSRQHKQCTYHPKAPARALPDRRRHRLAVSSVRRVGSRNPASQTTQLPSFCVSARLHSTD